jgi:hypothetical protein
MSCFWIVGFNSLTQKKNKHLNHTQFKTVFPHKKGATGLPLHLLSDQLVFNENYV